MIQGSISTVAQTIQLAVAPVFLLAGIAGILNVVATRLARVVDRVRTLERHIPKAEQALREQELSELAILGRRMNICHLSIGLCTASALLICMVVMILFLAGLTRTNYGASVSLLFIGATLCLTLGLLLFLAEVTIATRSVRVNEQFVLKKKRRP
jgi:type IV secretory pathway VirB6-like protein